MHAADIQNVMPSSWTMERVEAIPSLAANDIDAALIHEAAIGKIAGEQ